MTSPEPRALYRIVRTNPPTLRDFTSYQSQGIPPPDDEPETMRLWRGLSAYVTLARARRRARMQPQLGRYIARLELPVGGAVAYERTTRSQGHFTVWGAAADVLACVVSVVPIEPVR